MPKIGWVKLHRQIMNHDFYREPRKFSKFEAWIDLLLRANHEDIPGSLVISYSKLAQAWGWSKSGVWNFIKRLEHQNMVVFPLNDFGTNPEQKQNKNGTIITIVNWDLYQGKKNETETKAEQKRNKTGTKTENLPITEKEEKNIEKKAFADFVYLTKDEAAKLAEEFGIDGAKAIVEILNNYKGATGKTYKSDYMAIRNWVIDRYKEGRKKGLYSDGDGIPEPPH